MKQEDIDNTKLLIVEDDQGLNRLISKKIASFDCQYQQAYTGQEALNLIKDNDFDLLLLDYQLPDMTAKDIITQIEQLPAFIVMTGNGNEQVAVEMMKLGAADYLVKDYNFIELLPEVINHVLKELDNQRKLKEAYQQLEQEEKKYQLLFENTGTATAIVEEDGVISLVNEEFEVLTGYNKTELEDEMSFKDLVAEEEDLVEIFRCAEKKELEELLDKYEIKIKDKRGKRRDVLIKVKIIPETKGRIVSMLDITQRKEREEELNKAYRQINQNIEKARKLHQHFLPQPFAKIDQVSIAAYYKPADELGGDFYNFQEVNNKLVFYVADVTGHGLDGAMLNLLVREQINNFIAEARFCPDYTKDVDSTINSEKMMQAVLENYLEQEFPEDYFLCMQIGVLDLVEHNLEYSNAGFHILPYVLSIAGELSTIENSHLPITNIEAAQDDFSSASYDLNPGDKLFITTDGLIEESKSGEIYGQERLKKLLKDYYYLPVDILLERIKADLREFTGDLNSKDDITFLILEREMDTRLVREINSDFSEMYQLEEEIMDFLEPYFEELDFLQMGFHEIITNAIEHGNNLDDEKKVQVEVALCNQYIRILVEDQGVGFDWEEKLKVDCDDVGFAERGRGLIMANQIYDQMNFNQQGNQVCLIKNRPIEPSEQSLICKGG